jgi:hypothetical protein
VDRAVVPAGAAPVAPRGEHAPKHSTEM